MATEKKNNVSDAEQLALFQAVGQALQGLDFLSGVGDAPSLAEEGGIPMPRVEDPRDLDFNIGGIDFGEGVTKPFTDPLKESIMTARPEKGFFEGIGDFFSETFSKENFNKLIQNPWALMGLMALKSEFIDRRQREKEAQALGVQIANSVWGTKPTVKVRPDTSGADIFKAGLTGLAMQEKFEDRKRKQERADALNKILERVSKKPVPIPRKT